MLEITGTIEKRKMRDQVLDSMELERERGITIKMQPVRMMYELGMTNKGDPHSKFLIPHSLSSKQTFVLNLIDTPGHIDFSYEVSRALSAVEGALLLVDATQGIQAQTLTTLQKARDLGLTIIPVVSKIDSPLARTDEVRGELARLLNIESHTVLSTSGKTGEGVRELLEEIVHRVPAPRGGGAECRALVFDFKYSDHRGIVMYLRVMDGALRGGEKLSLAAAEEHFTASEIGIFTPEESPREVLSSGEIGYVVSGIKKPGIAIVGDTLRLEKSAVLPLPGYEVPKPVVWASVYPESQDDFVPLRQALLRLRLTDAALSFEEEASGTLGRGFRCGFLGMLHVEIVTERLRREHGLTFITTLPSITYEVTRKGGKREMVYTPIKFPEFGSIESVREPWAAVTIVTPEAHVGAIVPLLYEHEADVGDTTTFAEGRVRLAATMPLRELMRNFFDKLKSVSSGYASLSYERIDSRSADVVRLDLVVADELVPAFSRIVGRRRVEEEAEAAVERLEKILPRQLFATKIQAQALGRILASRRLAALRKDVTGYLYGGDITRKRKLWEKQKRGKKRMEKEGRVTIPHEVFLSMLRG
jgi:GTP-binding protein LepA